MLNKGVPATERLAVLGLEILLEGGYWFELTNPLSRKHNER